jgi:hypothetical protein
MRNLYPDSNHLPDQTPFSLKPKRPTIEPVTPITRQHRQWWSLIQLLAPHNPSSARVPGGMAMDRFTPHVTNYVFINQPFKGDIRAAYQTFHETYPPNARPLAWTDPEKYPTFLKALSTLTAPYLVKPVFHGLASRLGHPRKPPHLDSGDYAQPGQPGIIINPRGQYVGNGRFVKNNEPYGHTPLAFKVTDFGEKKLLTNIGL